MIKDTTMKTIYALALSVCFILSCQLSEAQTKFGNVTMDELNMEVYPLDSAASAVILLKKGDCRFTISELYGFQFEHNLQVKIKILKPEGLDLCNHEIEYYEASNSSKEQINGLSGTTYNLEDGKIVKTKLSKEFITEEDQDNKYRIRKFTMPAAKVGSVIEYKYTIVSPFFYNLRDFDFQEEVPIAYTSYEVVIPEYFKYNTNFQGYVPLKTKRSPENGNFHLRGDIFSYSAEKIEAEGTDVPAMKKEGYLWSVNDYISRVSFELRSIQMPMRKIENYSSSWTNIDNELLSSSSFGGNTKKADLFKEEIQVGEITLAKAKEIQDMVKYKAKWNERNTIYPRNLKETLKTGLGNNADVNFLLINALKAGGFDAFPVILSTRGNGRIPFTYASMSSLNYVITGVQIDTVIYYTDAASKYGDWNLLPQKCMVPQARIIRPDACEWVDLTSTSNGAILKNANFEFIGDEYVGKVTDTRKGNEAYDLRYAYNAAKDQNEFIEGLSKTANAEISDFNITNLDNNSENLKVEYIQKAKINDGSEFIYLNPLINKHISENPFRSETRTYPIDFDYLSSYIQLIQIKIPEGYQVEEMPKPARMVMNDNDITFTYRIGVEGNVIKVHYQYVLKKLNFGAVDYEGLKDFYAKLVAKNSEQIVLKRISTDSI